MKATQHPQAPALELSSDVLIDSPVAPLTSIHSPSRWCPFPAGRRPCSPLLLASPRLPVSRTHAASPGPMICSMGLLPSPHPCPHSSIYPPGIRASCREIAPLFDSHRKQNVGAPSQDLRVSTCRPLLKMMPTWCSSICGCSPPAINLEEYCSWHCYHLIAMGQILSHGNQGRMLPGQTNYSMSVLLLHKKSKLSTEGEGAKTRLAAKWLTVGTLLDCSISSSRRSGEKYAPETMMQLFLCMWRFQPSTINTMCLPCCG